MISYVETHYRPFRFFPNLLYKKQPEILFDAPCRIEPGCPIPVFLIIKDADMFPVELDSVVIHLRYEGGIERIAQFPYNGLRVDSGIWWDSINITPEYLGKVRIDPYVSLKIGKKKIHIRVDNYKGCHHEPLNIYAADEPLPSREGWYHGDIHCHTYYTADQVEFGAPMEVMAFASYCMGMNWLSVTDHSYDLDNAADSYRLKDSQLSKWHHMKKTAERLSPTATIIPGEEITVAAENGKNCHMLALNAETFIHGTGDSGQNGLNRATEMTVGSAAAECTESGGIACAAHPFERIPLLEKFILNRGPWTPNDLRKSGITAVQFYNGVRDRGFYRGKNAWIGLLLEGRRIYAFGGNDAHGDLNRKRTMDVPFVSVTEKNEHLFGNVRTVVRAKSPSKDDILEALTFGRALVTDGPFIDLSLQGNDRIFRPGDTIRAEFSADDGKETVVSASFVSSPEFGRLKTVKILGGPLPCAVTDRTGNIRQWVENGERVLFIYELGNRKYSYEYSESFRAAEFQYLRAECETDMHKICITNPVWLDVLTTESV